MKIDIKNLINSPYKIGTEMIPASGELKGFEVDNAQLAMLKSLGYFLISESKQEEAPRRGRPPKSKFEE